MVLQQAASDPQNFHRMLAYVSAMVPGRLWAGCGTQNVVLMSFISMANSIFCPPVLDIGVKGERFVSSK